MATPLRMASITLPLLDNDGKPVPEAHEYLMAKLVTTFGGCSRSAMDGHWQSDAGTFYANESVLYRVAMADTLTNQEALRSAAYVAGVAAKQLCVLIVLPNGNVEFEDTSQTVN